MHRCLVDVLLFLLSAAIIVAGVSSASSLPETADVLYWPISSTQPSILSRVSYDPSTLESSLSSYNPPTSGEGGEEEKGLVRVGLFVSTPSNPKQWVGSLTSMADLMRKKDNGYKPTLRLHLGPSGKVYYASWSLSSLPLKRETSMAAANVEIVPSEPGPSPVLNRPVVVKPDGGMPEDIPEKTFFQK